MLRRPLIPPINDDPVQRFVSLMHLAMQSGTAYLLDINGHEPESPERCGWHKVNGHGYQPKGLHIGWVDGDDLLLEPQVYEILQCQAACAGKPLLLLPETLWKRLRDAGLLHGWDRCVTRRTVHGRVRYVLNFNARRVLGEASTRH